jgi:glycine cleavage system H protein
MRIGSMEFPDELAYDRFHGWIRVEGNVAVHGMTDLGQRIAEQTTFVGLPSEGQDVYKTQTLASVESSKWVGRLRALVSGRVVDRNLALVARPALVNESPYAQGWVAKVEMSDTSELNDLMHTDSPEFAAYVEEAYASYGDLADI